MLSALHQRAKWFQEKGHKKMVIKERSKDWSLSCIKAFGNVVTIHIPK